MSLDNSPTMAVDDKHHINMAAQFWQYVSFAFVVSTRMYMYLQKYSETLIARRVAYFHSLRSLYFPLSVTNKLGEMKE